MRFAPLGHSIWTRSIVPVKRSISPVTFTRGFTRSRSTHGAALDHSCTKRDNARAFHRIRIFGEKNRGADFCDARGVGNSGAVITGARGNNS